MSQQLVDQVRSVLSDVLGVPLGAVTADATADMVESWDSVTHVSVVMALEGQFGVSFDPDEVPALVSVPAIVERVSAKQR